MDEQTNIEEKLDFIRTQDPEGAAKLERLLGKKGALKEGNVYNEKFTDRQFSLVFNPLLDASLERAKVLEALSKSEGTIYGLSDKLNVGKEKIFNHIKELMRKNLVEIAGHKDRDAIFRRK
jgi:hypothetical protein